MNVNVRPYYAEGSKTLGYEVAEQLGWRLPQQVVIPVASGSQLTKVDKAFRELVPLGLVEDTPYKIFGAQATGCSPVSAAFKARPRRGPPGQARHHRQVAGDRQPGRRPLRARRRPGAPAAPSRTSPTTRSSRASSCSPAPRASSPRPPAASRWRRCSKLLATGQLDPEAETVVLQHRRRPEDPRRGRRPGRPGGHDRAELRRLHRRRPRLSARYPSADQQPRTEETS